MERLDALRALGVVTAYLNDAADNLPWDLVAEVACGSSTDTIKFRAPHPCGITFAWSAQLPTETAGAHTALQLAAKCSEILGRLPANMRVKASAIMWDKIHTMRARAVRLREEVAIIETVERDAGAAIKAKVLP